MKKYFKFLPLLLIPFLFCSCIDYVQSISFKDGKYNLYYKVTVSKMLFAMANQNPDEIFDGIDNITPEDFPIEAKCTNINTDLEAGIEWSIKISPTDIDDAIKPYLPSKADNKYYIPTIFAYSPNDVPSLQKIPDRQTEAITNAILSSAKMRIHVSKKIVPSITSAYLETKNQEDTLPVSFYDLGESYCFELPIIILYATDMYKIDKIICID